MYGRISKWIACWCCNEDNDDYEIVAYGWSVILENIVKTIILIGIGIWLHQFKEVLIILISFCGVRVHAGGIHAKSTFGCTLFMIFIELSSLVFNKYVNPAVYVYFIMGIMSNILIWMYAPNGSESCNFLSAGDKAGKKKWALITVNLLFLASIVLQIQRLVFISITIEAMSLLLYEIQRRKSDENKNAMV